MTSDPAAAAAAAAGLVKVKVKVELEVEGQVKADMEASSALKREHELTQSGCLCVLHVFCQNL